MMRVLAGIVLTAVTVIMAPSGAQAETSSELKMCLDNATRRRSGLWPAHLSSRMRRPQRPGARPRLPHPRQRLPGQDDYGRAQVDFDAATKADPTAYGPFNSRGVALLRQKQLDRAITEFDSAIRLNPNDPMALTNRGDTYRNKGRFDRALQDYDAAIAINPKWVNACFGRAAALQQKATSDFDAFVNEGRFERWPSRNTAGSCRSPPARRRRRQPRPALSCLTQIRPCHRRLHASDRDQSANPVFLRNRALTYRMMRRFDLAIADYRARGGDAGCRRAQANRRKRSLSSAPPFEVVDAGQCHCRERHAGSTFSFDFIGGPGRRLQRLNAGSWDRASRPQNRERLEAPPACSTPRSGCRSGSRRGCASQ